MKLTWFGGTALRAHIGGEIVIVDAEQAADGVERAELCSGANKVVSLNGQYQPADPALWRARAPQRLLDAGETVRPVEIWSLGPRAVLIAPDEDLPLVVLGGAVPSMGRWVEQCVVVLAGQGLDQRAKHLVETSAPRLIALAGEEALVDAAIDAIRGRLDRTGLVALELGLAVEV